MCLLLLWTLPAVSCSQKHESRVCFVLCLWCLINAQVNKKQSLTAQSVSDETSGDVQLTGDRDRTTCRGLLVDRISYRCHTCAQSQCELPLCTNKASTAGIMSAWLWWRILYRLYDLAMFDLPYLYLELSVLCWPRCQFVGVDHQCVC